MRTLLFTIAWLACGSSAAAQQLARVETTARVRVPDFMFLERGTVTEGTLEAGRQVRRVTLFITANRSWRLEVARSCASQCTAATYTVKQPAGKPGNSQRVVIEYQWDARTPAPRPDEFEYLLVGS